MGAPMSMELHATRLPERHPREVRWRYDAVQGDRIEGDATVTVDATSKERTKITFDFDIKFPVPYAEKIINDMATLVQEHGLIEEDH